MITTASGALEYVLERGKIHYSIGSFFVCNSLDLAADYRWTTDAARNRAKQHIHKLLGGRTTLNRWVRDHCDEANELWQSDQGAYWKKMHETRLAWIEDMIKWHKANGD